VNNKLNSTLSSIASKLDSNSERSLIFERFLHVQEVLDGCEEFGHTFRDRIYTPAVTLWMFLGQTLSPDHSCRDAVHRLSAWRVSHGKPKVDSNATSIPLKTLLICTASGGKLN